MLAYLYVLLAVAVRLLSGLGYVGTMGFVPLEASLLFFGSRMPRKHFLPPLALLIVTDIYLTTQSYGLKLNWEQGFIWAFYVGVFFAGSLLKNRVKPLSVVVAALASATGFFIISDFGVWLGTGLYPHTWSGLAACYVAALPFFGKGILSNLLFSAIFFGLPAWYARLNRSEAVNKAAA
ncbi:MAG TPA: DUF6580 family putative transport protein [Candidatus Angelobacter sp.]